MITLHENMVRALRPAPVIALALNTFDLSDEQAQRAIEAATVETGLPCTDPVRYAPDPIAGAISTFHWNRVGRVTR
jgi:uncharacterized NAD-dependent epimerase/dehydratase family protein